MAERRGRNRPRSTGKVTATSSARERAQAQIPGRSFVPKAVGRAIGAAGFALEPTPTAREVDTNPAYKDPVMDRKKPTHRDNSPSTSFDYESVNSSSETPNRASAPKTPKVSSADKGSPSKPKAEKTASPTGKSTRPTEMDLNKLTKAGYSHSDLVKMRKSEGGKKKIEDTYKKVTGKSAKYK